MAFYRDFRNLIIDGSPAYVRSVVEQLNKAWATWTGWAVLRSILDTGRTVRFVPYSMADRKKMGPSNAYVTGTSGRDNRPRGARPYAGGVDDPTTPQDERFRRAGFFCLPGTGRGGMRKCIIRRKSSRPRCPRAARRSRPAACHRCSLRTGARMTRSCTSWSTP